MKGTEYVPLTSWQSGGQACSPCDSFFLSALHGHGGCWKGMWDTAKIGETQADTVDNYLLVTACLDFRRSSVGPFSPVSLAFLGLGLRSGGEPTADSYCISM